MQLIAITLVAIIGIIVVAGAVRAAFAYKKHPKKTRWVIVFGYALVALGGTGFFGLAFSSVGGLRCLPTTFEWPVGFVHGPLTMPDGTHVIPVALAGNRIQIYGPDWQFVRAWYVPAGGGGRVSLQIAQTNRIEVIARIHTMRYLYNLDGSLISAQTYAPKTFHDFPGSNESIRVPTPWWFWMLTSPMHSWLVFAFGLVLVFLNSRKIKNGSLDSQPSAPPHAGPTINS